MTDENPAESDETGITAHIMNAKDLGAIDQVKRCIEFEIDALKIEGRMKSNLYVANAVNTYRTLLDESHDLKTAREQIKAVSNREFSNGFLEQHNGSEAISFDWNGYQKGVQFIGTIKQAVGESYLIQVKSPTPVSTPFMAISPGCALAPITITGAEDLNHDAISELAPNSCAIIRTSRPLGQNSIIVKAVSKTFSAAISASACYSTSEPA